jgi:hypothetical protein
MGKKQLAGLIDCGLPPVYRKGLSFSPTGSRTSATPRRPLAGISIAIGDLTIPGLKEELLVRADRRGA